MEYEWDEAKRQANIEKHRIGLEAANEFEWDTAIKVPTMRHGELRFIATGYIGDRLHTVIYAERGSRLRSSACAGPAGKRRGNMPKLKPDHVSPVPATVDLTQKQINEIAAGSLTFDEVESKVRRGHRHPCRRCPRPGQSGTDGRGLRHDASRHRGRSKDRGGAPQGQDRDAKEIGCLL